MSNNGSSPLVLWYNQLGMNDVDRVGGKNASLGEMITNLSGMGVSVPNGFATTADAFNQFLDQSGVNQRIYALLDETDIDDVSALAKAGAQIRQWIIDTPFQSELENAIRDAYDLLSADDAEASFAVRSSATAEDMPDASFAGQQDTFLNVQGFDAVLVAVKHVFASLFNDRAISPTACIRVTITAAWRSPPGCRGWSAPIWPPPASCSPSIPNPALTRWCLSPRRGVWARWWCRAR